MNINNKYSHDVTIKHVLPRSTNPLEWGTIIDQYEYIAPEAFSIINNYVLYRKLIISSINKDNKSLDFPYNVTNEYIYKVLSYDDEYGNNYHYTIIYYNGEIIGEFRDTKCYAGPSIRIINHNLKYFSYETLN